MIRPEAIIPLVSILCYAGLTTIVARKLGLRREAKLFLGYLVVVMLWSFGSFMMHANLPVGNTILWNYFLAVWPPFAAVFYFHFVIVFLRKPQYFLWLVAGFLLCVIWLFALAKGQIIQQAYISENAYHVQFGPGFFALFPPIFCFVCVPVFWLAKEFRSTRDPFIRNRVGYLLIGITLQLLLATTNLSPWSARYPIDQVGNVINALLIGYAILKYKLLDIDIVFRKGSLYMVLTGFIVTVYFVIAMLLHTLVRTRTGYDIGASVLLMAIVVAALFRPLYRATERQLNRLFDRKRYDYREVLRSSSEAAASTIDLKELVCWIVDKVSQTIGVEKASIVLLEGERQRYYLKACKGSGNFSEGTACFRHDSPLTKYLGKENHCFTADDIDRIPRFRALWKSEKEVLRKLDAAVLVPLKAREMLIGLLILGPKKSGEAYTSEDLNLLSTVANQVATAVWNAQLYEKSRQAYKELKAAQDRLLRTERLRAVGEVAAGVGHDLRNLLTVIVGRAELTLEGVQHNGKLKRNLQVIEQAALDGAEVVNRLQNFTKVSGDLSFDLVDVNRLLLDAMQMVKPRLSQQQEMENMTTNVILNLGEAGLVKGKPSELREMLTNILVNAIEAMPRGGKLTITSRQENDSVVISIEDTGVGIASKARKRIFEPFYTTKGHQGVGLGLSIAYNVAKRHGGDIRMSSKLGKGSTFTISLPVTKQRRARQAVSGMPYSITRKTAALIIDDDKVVGEVLSEILEGNGYSVDLATSGKEGLALAQRKDYAVVITDLGMPGMSGRDVAKAINTVKPATPIFLITGWDVELQPAELIEWGVTGVITKPFTRRNILTQIKRTIRGGRSL